MIQERKNLKDKRKHPRFKRKLSIKLKISFSGRNTANLVMGVDSIIALAESKNHSIDGMSLQIVASIMDSKRSLTPSNAVHLVGRPIEVLIDNGKIAMWGNVVRADAKALEIAIKIYKVSDEKLWSKFCTENDIGNIFTAGSQLG